MVKSVPIVLLTAGKNAKIPIGVPLLSMLTGIDCVTDPLPIQPTAHYSMGGIPVDKGGHVVIDAEQTKMQGFFAAGECSCVSVHGGNRLGTNSLLEAVVFGERADLFRISLTTLLHHLQR